MSPFRAVLAARGVRHPAAYSIMIVIAGCLMSMVVAVTISIQASNRAIARVQHAEEQRRAAEARQAAANRAASCAFIKTINEAYREDPPSPPSETYKTIAKAWADLAALCE